MPYLVSQPGCPIQFAEPSQGGSPAEPPSSFLCSRQQQGLPAPTAPAGPGCAPLAAWQASYQYPSFKQAPLQISSTFILAFPSDKKVKHLYRSTVKVVSTGEAGGARQKEAQRGDTSP